MRWRVTDSSTGPTIRFDTGVSLSGRLWTQGEADTCSLRLSLCSEASPARSVVPLAASGAFELNGVEPGFYRLTAERRDTAQRWVLIPGFDHAVRVETHDLRLG